MSERMLEPQEPMPFRVLLDEGVRRARQHFKALYLPIALVVAVLQVAIVAAQGFFMTTAFKGIAADATDVSTFIAGYLGFIVLVLVISALSYLAYGVMGAAAVDATAGRRPDLGRSLLLVLKPRYVFTMLGAAFGIFLGMLCCIAPGLILSLIWGFIVPVMVEEGQTLGNAFARSSALARYNPEGHWTGSPMVKIFVLLVVGVLLSYAVSFLFQMPFAILQQLWMLREAASENGPEALLASGAFHWLQVPGTVLGSLAQTAVMLYLNFGIALLYFDVRRRWEGSDLVAAADELAAPPAPGGDRGPG